MVFMQWIVFISFVAAINCEISSEYFLLHKNKRLTTVTKSLTMNAPLRCVMHCLVTNDCVAVNILANGNRRCELTSGLDNLQNFLEDNSSQVYAIDYNKCVEDPGFCLNGATCEPIMNYARCHCTDRYQGDRCDQCSERFRGNGCLECAQGFYGDSCDMHFATVDAHDCNQDNNLGRITATGDLESCRSWCLNRDGCGGFTIWDGYCYFKDNGCDNDAFPKQNAILHIKQTV